MQNETLRYEFEFINYLNQKTYGELSDKWKKHLKRMFPNIKEDTVVYCSKHENYFAKGDIDIRIKGNRKIIRDKDEMLKKINNLKNIFANTINDIEKEKTDNWYSMPENVVGRLLDAVSGTGPTDPTKSFMYYYLRGTE